MAPPGQGAGTLPIQPSGVVGYIKTAGGEAVTAGTVYFVPAGDVAALPATTIELNSTNDEPLEDVIATNGGSYQKAAIGSDGAYALTTLSDGSYFVTYVPAEGDTSVLPGGSGSRRAVSSAQLVGTQLDLSVSSAVPADAHYVGSGVCVSCHGGNHIAETMHRIGIWSGYEVGKLQNLEPRFDDLYQAIEEKFEAAPTGGGNYAGTKIYFHKCGWATANGVITASNCYATETDPGTGVAFTVTVRRTGDDLEVVLDNVLNPADQDVTYRVDYIYGGGVKKQRYVTTLSNAAGNYGALLPFQFQHDGSDANYDPTPGAYDSGRTRTVWRDYNAQRWFKYNATDPTLSTLAKPNADASFEKNCVSCHAAGVQITKQVSASDPNVYTWKAAFTEDRFFDSGDFDYPSSDKGNGVKDEMNVGCESCHGPGSRHWEATGQGKYIVSPSLLTPERESMICGQCHSRPRGFYGTESPINEAGFMMIAGTSRNDFLNNYTNKTQLDGTPSDFWSDPDLHSKSHHQQYSDFIRSAMYKNGNELMTCSSCHDPHQRTDYTRQLRNDPTDNTASCGSSSCHAAQATDLEGHLDAAGIPLASVKAGIALCGDCHLTKTAQTGAGKKTLLINGIQYWKNDITSHLFKVPDRALATSIKMPVPYTKECGTCHAALNVAP